VIGIDKSKVASMIYRVKRNKWEGIGFTKEYSKPKAIQPLCSNCIKKGLKAYLVPEVGKNEVLNQSEPEDSESQTLNKSEPKIPKFNVLNKPESKTSKIEILKRPEPMTSKSQVLLKIETRFLKAKIQTSSISQAKMISRPKDFKLKVLNESKSYNFKHKAQMKSKPFRTNPKEPKNI